MDDTIIFGVGGFGGLRSVSAGGGEPEAFTEPPPGVSHRWPEILPGNRAVLFSVHERSLQNSSIAVVPFDRGEPKVLVPGGSNPRYAPTGHIIYGVNGTLRAVGFDLDRLEVTTDPVPVVDGVVTKATGAVDFGIASGGSLLYVAGSPVISQRLLAWAKRDGSVVFLNAPPRAYMYPRISSDGTRVALDVRDQETDIWIWELERESLSRLTLDPANDTYPVWSADGARVAFASSREGRRASIFWKNADGTGTVEQLVGGEVTQRPGAFSPDGRLLVYQEISPRSSDIHVLSLDGGTKASIIASDFEERNPELSRDGRWIAFESDESGQPEVYVHPFPNTDEGRWKISTAGGTRPLWAPDDSELFYLTEDGTLMAVAVQTHPEFTVGDAEVLLEGVYLQGPPGRVYDLHPDGERFLIIQVPGYEEASAKPSLILVQNWFEELQRLVPSN